MPFNRMVDLMAGGELVFGCVMAAVVGLSLPFIFCVVRGLARTSHEKNEGDENRRRLGRMDK